MSKAAYQAAVDDITTCLAAGLDHSIASKFPLMEVAAAHEAVEGGQIVDKVIVES